MFYIEDKGAIDYKYLYPIINRQGEIKHTKFRRNRYYYFNSLKLVRCIIRKFNILDKSGSIEHLKSNLIIRYL